MEIWVVQKWVVPQSIYWVINWRKMSCYIPIIISHQKMPIPSIPDEKKNIIMTSQ